MFINGYAVSLFTPTIIHDLGYSAANAQLLSVPPFACASIFTIIFSFYSDRTNLRGPFIVLCSIISMTGYIIAYTTSNPGPGYAATVLAASGAYPNIAISLAWAGGNAGGSMKRGVALALVIGLGNLGGCVFYLGLKLWGDRVLTSRMSHRSICSSFIYYQPPRFHKGHGTVLGCLGMRYVLARHREEEISHSICVMGSIVCSCIMMWTYKRLNKEKEEQCTREGIKESMKDLYRDLADESPLFR